MTGIKLIDTVVIDVFQQCAPNNLPSMTGELQNVLLDKLMSFPDSRVSFDACRLYQTLSKSCDDIKLHQLMSFYIRKNVWSKIHYFV